jgi:site-specific DNA recombinase
LDAYQEDLIQLDELRSRMPELRKREKSLNEELICIESELIDQGLLLKLADNIEKFLIKLRGAADNMSVVERQRVLRLVVKEVLIDDENIRVKHSIPLPHSNMQTGLTTGTKIPSYLLHKGRDDTPLRRSFTFLFKPPVLMLYRCCKPPSNVHQLPRLFDVLFHRSHQQVVIDLFKEAFDVHVLYPAASGTSRLGCH